MAYTSLRTQDRAPGTEAVLGSNGHRSPEEQVSALWMPLPPPPPPAPVCCLPFKPLAKVPFKPLAKVRVFTTTLHSLLWAHFPFMRKPHPRLN